MRAVTTILVAVLAANAAGQQNNDPLATLSINGTGRIDAAGATIPDSSMMSPTPPGSAPIYHHRTAPGASLELRVDGPPGLPFLLLAGASATTPIAIGPDLLEIDPGTIQLLLNGANPTSFFDYSAFVGFGGVGQLFNTIGLPPGFGPLTLQAIIVDPTAAPFGYRFTASVTVAVENGLETLARNLTDSLNEAATNPSYLPSLCSNGFKHDGLSAAQLTILQAAGAAGLTDDDPEHLAFEQIGPDSAGGPPLPTGLPTPGLGLAIYYQTMSTLGDPFCGSTPLVLADRSRLPGLQVVEQGGIWKVHGNQRDVSLEGGLQFSFGTSTTSGVDVHLRLTVEDELGARGGIASVAVSGPQLASVNANGEATSAAVGMQPMLLDDGGGSGPSSWALDVELAVAAAGTSRLPLVELPGGSRDTYQVTVTWNDTTCSGPYLIVLRSPSTSTPTTHRPFWRRCRGRAASSGRF